MTCREASWLMLVLWAVILGHACPENHSGVRFAAWNIRTFGRSKMAKPGVVDIIIQIIQRYDLIIIQEIRDSTGKAIQNLLMKLNNESPHDPFEMTLSARLGRTQTKEQYAFLYRSRKLRLLDTYQYPDPADIFEREPYSALFSAKGIGKFVVTGIHTSPSQTKKEISALYDVINEVKKLWKTKKILIAGDLNAGCDYVRSWRGVTLHSDNQFHWLITDAQDTTATTTKCPYDRLIVHDALHSSIIPDSAGVLHFDELLQLSTTEALLVSDHYPVQLRFKDTQVSAYNGVTGASSRMVVTWNDVRKKVMHVVFSVMVFKTFTSE